MNKELQSIIDNINAQQRLRVWSLILTFFGDAIVARGGTVSAQTVSQLMQVLGIEDGTVRTAFSRLTKDGWVIRSKTGRSSYYSLAEKGYKPFSDATSRIYSIPNTAKKTNNKWLLATANTTQKEALKNIAEKHQALVLDGSNVIFSNETDQLLKQLEAIQCLVTEGTSSQVPEWVTQTEVLNSLKTDFQVFMKNFKHIPKNLSPIEAMAARCLLIHEWRRLILRTPLLSSSILPQNWPAESCGKLVSDHYSKLFDLSNNWLNGKANSNENWEETNLGFHNYFITLQK